MLRRGLAALVLGMICSGSVLAGDMMYGQPGRSSSVQGSVPARRSQQAPHRQQVDSAPYPGRGAQHAAARGNSESFSAGPGVYQTAGTADGDVVYVGQSQPQPVPIRNPPVLPNTSTVSGPQNFSAVPVGQISNPVPVYPGQNWQEYSAPVPVHQTSSAQFSPISPEGMAGPVSMGMEGPVRFNESTGQYPQTGAALYPSPVPGIPWQIGGASIPNQAFHPHEMLYEHGYRAMYPPYYYKVNGGWMVTPFGVWSHEDWNLQGTTVDVQYKSHISPFSLYRGKGH